MNKISIMDVSINNVTKTEAGEKIRNRLEMGGDGIFTIFTPNTEIVMLCNGDSELKKNHQQGKHGSSRRNRFNLCFQNQEASP